MALSMERLMSTLTAPFGGLVKVIRKRSLMVIVVSLLTLTVLNLGVMGNVGGITQSRSLTIFVGMIIVLFTLLFLIAIYFEYKKRFPIRAKGVEDIVCRDCNYFAGKTLLCEGCDRNPYDKKRQKFDLLESI